MDSPITADAPRIDPAALDFFRKHGVQPPYYDGLDADPLQEGFQIVWETPAVGKTASKKVFSPTRFPPAQQLEFLVTEFEGLPDRAKYDVFQKLTESRSGRRFLNAIYFADAQDTSLGNCRRHASSLFGKAFLRDLYWAGALALDPNNSTAPMYFRYDTSRDAERLKRLWEPKYLPAQPLWRRRLWVLKTLYGMQEERRFLHLCRARNFDKQLEGQLVFPNHNFEDGAGYFMQTLYQARPELFDTDQDGWFDNEDLFPLDHRFHYDTDGDHMPDALDPFPTDPAQWDDLRVGERRDVTFPATKTPLYSVSREKDGIHIQITLYLTTLEDKPLEPALAERLRAGVASVYNRHLPNGIRLDLRFADRSGATPHHVRVEHTPGPQLVSIEHPDYWLLEGTNDRLRSHAHELGHLLGLEEHYDTVDAGIWEFDFQYGIGRNFLIARNHLMSNGSSADPQLPIDEAMIIAGVAMAATDSQIADPVYESIMPESLMAFVRSPFPRETIMQQMTGRRYYLWTASLLEGLTNEAHFKEQKKLLYHGALEAALRAVEREPLIAPYYRRAANLMMRLGAPDGDIVEIADVALLQGAIALNEEALSLNLGTSMMQSDIRPAYRNIGRAASLLFDASALSSDKQRYGRLCIDALQQVVGDRGKEALSPPNGYNMFMLSWCAAKLAEQLPHGVEQSQLYKQAIYYADRSLDVDPSYAPARQLKVVNEHRLSIAGQSFVGETIGD